MLLVLKSDLNVLGSLTSQYKGIAGFVQRFLPYTQLNFFQPVAASRKGVARNGLILAPSN